jgi:hypothetical protein
MIGGHGGYRTLNRRAHLASAKAAAAKTAASAALSAHLSAAAPLGLHVRT